MKILLLANSGITAYKLRKEFIEKLIINGYTVYVVSPYDEYVPRLRELGCTYIEIKFNRREKNPFKEIVLIIDYYKVIKKTKPDVVLTYTIKPNIYCGIICSVHRIPYLTNITGLGTSIENRGILRKIVLFLYKVALKNSSCIFFQNEMNRQFFLKRKIVGKRNRLIPGSGVNLQYHKFEEYAADDKKLIFVFIGRVMKDKGIDELLKAAEKVKILYPDIGFNIIGSFEEDYSKKINEYSQKKIINYLGQQDDVRPFIKESHAIIHPSYHEGTANVLLETAAAGRPILASDVPGCRETFDKGISGLRFKARNAENLYSTIVEFIDIPYEQKRLMGIAGRKKMEKEYDRNIVINAYLEEIGEIGRIVKNDELI